MIQMQPRTPPPSPLKRFAIHRGGKLAGEQYAESAAEAARMFRWRNRIDANEWLEVKPWPGTSEDLPPVA